LGKNCPIKEILSLCKIVPGKKEKRKKGKKEKEELPSIGRLPP